MKLGIVGAGKIVKEFLPKLKDIDGIEVVGVMNRPSSLEKVKELCRENDVKNAVTTLEELKSLGVDTIYVAVPNHLHYSYCIKALELGMNVIVEKPIASNFTEANAIFDLAEDKCLFVYEAITTMYFDAMKKVREWLPKIGKVKLVTCNFSQYSSRYDNFRQGIIEAAFDRNKSGGALMDINLYNVYYVVGLFGRPLSAKYFANIENEIDTSGMLLMEYDGFVANCTGAKDCSSPLYFMIEGTDGCISMKYPPNVMGEVSLVLRNGEEETFKENMAMTRMIPEFLHFRTAIDKKDYSDFEEHKNDSMAVSEIITNARIAAGIRFAADDNVL